MTVFFAFKIFCLSLFHFFLSQVHKYAAAMRIILAGGAWVDYVMPRLCEGLKKHADGNMCAYNFTKQSLWHLILLAKRNTHVRAHPSPNEKQNPTAYLLTYLLTLLTYLLTLLTYLLTY